MINRITRVILCFFILAGAYGSSMAQTILFSPDTLFLGKIPLGSKSVRIMTVFNTSSTTMSITNFAIAGDGAENYKILNNPGTASLRQLGSVDIEIEFTPSAGVPSQAELVVTGNAPTSPDKVVLFGSGTQGSTVTFERLFGDEENDGLNSVWQTTDGGYILAGTTVPPGEDFTNILAVKTDKNGLNEWTVSLGEDNDTESAKSVLQTADGNYLVFGQTDSQGEGALDMYLMKLGPDGSMIWDKTFGGKKDEQSHTMTSTTDGGYLLVGNTRSFGDEFSTDLYVVKVNSNGDFNWQKTYGGIGGESVNEIIQTSDGNYVMAGTTSSMGAGSFDVYIIKIDGNGNLLWEKTFGGSGEDEGNDITELENGTFAISGYTVSYGAGGKDILLLNIDASGNALWYKVFGNNLQDIAYTIASTSSTIIVTGQISQTVNKRSFNIIVTDLQGNLIKQVSAASGKVGVNASDAIINSEGNLVLVGSSGSYSSSSEAYILNTSDFNVASSVETSENAVISNFELFQNYPNPFNNTTQITFNLTEASVITLDIFDITGKKVITLLNSYLDAGLHRIPYEGKNLSSGVYFIVLKAPTNFQVKQMMLLR